MVTFKATVPVWVRADGTFQTVEFDSSYDTAVKLIARPGDGEQLVFVVVELPYPRDYVTVQGEVTK
jgi:hypothetical protein